jgi:hypothetical protein
MARVVEHPRGQELPSWRASARCPAIRTSLKCSSWGNDGRIYTAAWDHHVADGKWRGWWNIQEGKNCPPGAPVSAVSRDPNKLDVFVVGNGGTVYTAAWKNDVAEGKWRGWWKIAP